jgi:hypothetical protein
MRSTSPFREVLSIAGELSTGADDVMEQRCCFLRRMSMKAT